MQILPFTCEHLWNCVGYLWNRTDLVVNRVDPATNFVEFAIDCVFSRWNYVFLKKVTIFQLLRTSSAIKCAGFTADARI